MGSFFENRRDLTGRILAYLAFGGALAIFVVHFLQNGKGLLNSCERGGDISLLALQTAQAADFRELLGPYSRYRFNHPGPILFYWYALVELLLGGYATPTGALFVGQLCLNLLCLVALLWVVVRRSYYPSTALLLVALLLVVMKQTGEVFLHYPWNPAALLFPAALFVGSLAALAAGHQRAAPLVAIAWAILASHHIGAAVWATAVGTGALLLHRRAVSRRSWLWLIAILGATLAVPLVLEACLSPDTSNVTRFLRYLRNHRARTTFAEGIAYFFSFYEVADESGVSRPRAESSSALLVGSAWEMGLALVLLLVPWWGRFSRHSLEWGTRTVTTLGVLVGIVLALRVDNTKYLYLMWFIYPVIGFQGWLCIQAAISRAVTRRGNPRRALMDGEVVVACCSVAGLIAAGCHILPQSYELGGYCQEVARVTVAKVEPSASYRLSIRGRDTWVPAAAIVNSMYRAGVQVCVDKRWGFLFGQDMVCPEPSADAHYSGERTAPQRVLTVTSKPNDGGEGRLIVSSPPVEVYVQGDMS